MTTTFVIEEKYGQWFAYTVDLETDEPTSLGTYTTGAEAVIVNGLDLSDFNVIYQPISKTSGANYTYNDGGGLVFGDAIPLWSGAVPPQPVDVQFPTIETEDIYRLFYGNLIGFAVTGTITPDVNYVIVDGPHASGPCCNTTTTTIAYTKKIEGSVSEHRSDNRTFSGVCLTRNCEAPSADVTYPGLQIVFNEGTSAIAYGATSHATIKDSSDIASVAPTGSSAMCMGSSGETTTDTTDTDFAIRGPAIGLFSGGDGTIRMRAMFFAGNEIVSLYAYAPLDAGDFHAVYEIPMAPIDTDGVTYTEITGSGPMLMGVQLELYGWKKDVDHSTNETSDTGTCGAATYSDNGTETYTPSLELTEITDGME